MFENKSLEIFGKDRNLLAIITPIEKDLNEKEMSLLMDIFNGFENGESCYLLQDNTDHLTKGYLLKELEQYFRQRDGFPEKCPHCGFKAPLDEFKELKSQYLFNSRLRLGTSKYVILICPRCEHGFKVPL